jgi:formate dehydrogenase beta subunit
LLEELDSNDQACFFLFEEDEMFTKRESELLQQYLQQHGELPGGGADELDDLF